jgi:hypothetical protein
VLPGGEHPPAPWTLRLHGLAWIHRAREDAARSHQAGLTYAFAVPLTVAAFARYEESPVGPYAEVVAAPTLVAHGRCVALGVPFIAVDSETSLEAGRANWALPKTRAAFATRATTYSASAPDGAWSVRARVVSAGMRLPLAIAGPLVQVADGGRRLRFTAALRGVVRLARVRVEATGVPWLTAGRHVGVIIERGTLVVGAPLASDP